MRVEGNIRANYLETGGQLSLHRTHIFGDLNLKGCAVTNGAILAKSLRVEGSINASYLKVSGSLVVVDFPSLDEAQRWADEDPYIAAGVYERVVVKPFKKVLP